MTSIHHNTGRAATAARPGMVRRIVTRLVVASLWVIAITFGAVTLLPQVTPLRTLVITGTSMTETIPLGSLIVSEPVADTKIAVGDIITFDNPNGSGERVTHRVTHVGRGDVSGRPTFRTKGDHNTAPDRWNIEYVDGTAWRVRNHVPHVGMVQLALQSPAARTVVVAAPAALLLLVVLAGIWGGGTPAAATNDDDELADDYDYDYDFDPIAN